MHLTADEREACAKFEQEFLHLCDQSDFDGALIRVLAQSEEIEEVRILRDALREIGLRGRQRALEIRNRFPLSLVQPGLDLECEDVARPAMFDRFRGIPDAVGGALELMQQQKILPPRQRCERLGWPAGGRRRFCHKL